MSNTKDYTNVFNTLNSIDVKPMIEKKGKMNYVSWSHAWRSVKTLFPNATRKVYEAENGLNYFTDGRTCFVKVGVTINDEEMIDYLPIMDYRMQRITADKVTSMDVNKAIQRSMTKAIAMHGLGLELWYGEDLPVEEKKDPNKKAKLSTDSPNYDKVLVFIEGKAKSGVSFAKCMTDIEKKYEVTPQTKKTLSAKYKSASV